MHPPAMLLLGPTAAGKTDVALAIAAAFPVEIISVDSALVYRGMDIGTAKPTPTQLAQVPHHLIDILDPLQPYSAARFAQDAQILIDQIRARGRLPLLVGGTMLYAKALMEGLHDLPAADPVLRDALNAQAAQRGWPALHQELAQKDPVTAARLAPNDAQRIQRALELIALTGMPLSALLAARKQAASAEARWLVIALEPSQRSVLHARIETRLRAMFDQGFLEEVAALRARGDLHLGLPSMRCVGYRQAWEHLDGLYGRDELLVRAIAATRQLAKRQLTWLRAMPQRQVFDCLAPDVPQQLRAWLGQHGENG